MPTQPLTTFRPQTTADHEANMLIRKRIAAQLMDIIELEKKTKKHKIIFLQGPRQSGKTTLIKQLQKKLTTPFWYHSVEDMIWDHPQPLLPHQNHTSPHGDDKDSTHSNATPAYITWLKDLWEQARKELLNPIRPQGLILCLDEIQLIPNFSQFLKSLWDEDRHRELPLQVIVLGSSPMIIQKSITESLFMRFHVVRSPHWSFVEMSETFGYSLKEYIYYGGYPGLVEYTRQNPSTWQKMVFHAIDTTLEKDMIKACDIEKPALIRRFFNQCIEYSGNILRLDTLLQSATDSGDMQTLQNYIDIFERTEVITGLRLFARKEHRKRRLHPKFIALNTAYMSAKNTLTLEQARNDPAYWGRLVETAAGAYLWNHRPTGCELYYWRSNTQPIYEIDYVLQYGPKIVAFEIKSSKAQKKHHHALRHFEQAFGIRPVVVAHEGGDISLEDFFVTPVTTWFT